jgi:hypothetical protein
MLNLISGYLFTGLSYFSWVCWIAPRNPTINNLFGVNTGLGMGILTFDWAQITWIGSPLVIPWWAIVNVGIGFVLCYWIIVPILYFTNVSCHREAKLISGLGIRLHAHQRDPDH